MDLADLFSDKSIKAKAKVTRIGEWLLSDELPVHELLAFAETKKGAELATAIEALEYATSKKPGIADESVLGFVTKALDTAEPKVKWESARVIGNVAHHFPDQLENVIESLLSNAGHPGTVVRWATAYALGEILKLKTDHNHKLLPAIEKLSAQEEDNGVRKKYLDALKKAKK
ncbi:HEAT repeat domain-containing protein [Dyadobacter sp. CY312]|uniref:HEAT repeat domain-containing protein n=1 Tax=Dyadobacter sp. CY312 TaxID=2907303 RepID=UPI001F2B80F6|nr:HEAT repeat domain-containing protein [Dyadobacter sp. CY312]MCE7042384.1 HEAT repeat domain-containing protein [Dyadobacter sp. CY312]